jgi:hypothetical protein
LLEQKLIHIKPAARVQNAVSCINMGSSVVQGEMHISSSGAVETQVVNLEDAVVGSLRITQDSNAATVVQAIGGFAGDWLHEAQQRLNFETSNLERLRRDATRTHELVSCSTGKTCALFSRENCG